MPKLTHEEKFKTAFDKIVSKEYDESVGKAQLTKIVNAWKKEELNTATIKRGIKEVILSVEPRKFAAWVYERYVYVPGYYWLDSSYRKYGDTVLGWYSEYQLQAEELPLKLSNQQHDEYRECRVLAWGGVWKGRGFVCAEDLPCNYSNSQKAEYSVYWQKRNYSLEDLPFVGVDWEVNIPTERLLFFAKLGYAEACKIQWERVESAYETDTNGYYVRRSIIPHGFWCAWKWWEGAKNWYYKHRPELFKDDEIWGDRELVWHTPPDSTSVVLGGKNRRLGEDLMFYIDGEA